MPRYNCNGQTGAARTDFYDDITNKIIAELEVGCVPSVQPWGMLAAKAPLAIPQNAVTVRRHKDRN